MSSSHVVLGNRDHRRALLVCIRRYMHAYGRVNNLKQGYPQLNSLALDCIKGIHHSLKIHDFLKRIKQNNLKICTKNGNKLEKINFVVSETLQYGERYLPDRYKYFGVISGVSKCLTEASKGLEQLNKYTV